MARKKSVTAQLVEALNENRRLKAIIEALDELPLTLALYEPADPDCTPREIDLDLLPKSLLEKFEFMREFNGYAVERPNVFESLGVFLLSEVERATSEAEKGGEA